MDPTENYILLPEYPEEVKQLFQVTSDFIKGLPLTTAQNDKLVQLMVDNVTAARKDGFLNGFLIGAGVMNDSPQVAKEEQKENGLMS